MFFIFLSFLGISAPVIPMPSDVQLMTRALRLAERARPLAHPNPMVGCVIAKGGRVVGEGWTAPFGGPHAEVESLRKAGPRAAGADVFVTLEPCSHWGKTPPCADALVQARVRRVVAAVRDPHRLVSGRGFAKLRRAGVKVETGLLEKEARFLNRAFFKAHTTGLPYLIWKTAQTLDGKTASRTGASRWISNPQAREFAHTLRAQSDAILVGGNTVRVDDPVLTSHGQGPDPVRVVISPSLHLSPSARVFRGGAPTLVMTSRTPPAARAKGLERAGAQILKCFMKKNSDDLKNYFKFLVKFGLNQILFEGGGDLAAGLLGARLIDEVYHVIAPHYLGGKDAKTSLEGRGWDQPGAGPALAVAESFPLGDNVAIHGFFRSADSRAWGI